MIHVFRDPTFRFCGYFLRGADRTVDRIIRAARSGKQNILEGAARMKPIHKQVFSKLFPLARKDS
ncbi:MAG: hypothetical protein NTZ01_07890 [Verrucomicrobia bacterium]|nr:hypothetical protein [Verrucomicrobiota bacterium]